MFLWKPPKHKQCLLLEFPNDRDPIIGYYVILLKPLVKLNVSYYLQKQLFLYATWVFYIVKLYAILTFMVIAKSILHANTQYRAKIFTSVP